MTSPLEQKKIKIAGPSVVTANRTWDGAVIYRTASQGWSTDLVRGRGRSHRPTRRARCLPNRSPTMSARSAPILRRSRSGTAARSSPAICANISAPAASPSIFAGSGVRSVHHVCLRRNRPHADQRTGQRVSRPGEAPSRRRTHRGRIQDAAAAERRLSAAARLHVPRRDPLRHAVVAAAAAARACRAALRPRLRPFHHAAEHPVQLDQARRTARCARRSRRGRHPRHADLGQQHAQRHLGPLGGRRARRDRGSPHLVRVIAAIHDPASGVLVPAAQVQIRDHRVRARSRRDQDPRHRAAPAPQRRGRNRLRGAGRRRARPHALHRQDDQAVRPWPRSAELCRGDPARLQPVRPPRQHLQGAHQDPGARTRHREIRRTKSRTSGRRCATAAPR